MLVILLTCNQLGLLRRMSNPAELRQTLVELGPWGYAAFVGVYAIFQPFGIPGNLFIWAAPLIWDWPVAFALSMTGSMAASVVGFSFARFIAREWVAQKIPDRFKKYDDALGRRAFETVFVLRIVFWMSPPLHAFFGVSKVPFWTHLWGSLAGYLVPLFLVSYFGESLVASLKEAPIEVWVALGVVAAVVGLVVWRRRRYLVGSAVAVSTATKLTPP